MDLFKELLLEKMLPEVGEGTSTYSYRTLRGTGGPFGNKALEVVYRMDSPIPINVTVRSYGTPSTRVMNVSFQAVTGEDEYGDIESTEPTNLGLEVLFKVLTTIKAIIKRFLKVYDFSVNTISYVAYGTKIGGKDSTFKASQRNRLYLAYIKKLFPTAHIGSRDNSGWEDNDKSINTIIQFDKPITYKDI